MHMTCIGLQQALREAELSQEGAAEGVVLAAMLGTEDMQRLISFCRRFIFFPFYIRITIPSGAVTSPICPVYRLQPLLMRALPRAVTISWRAGRCGLCKLSFLGECLLQRAFPGPPVRAHRKTADFGEGGPLKGLQAGQA